MIIFGSLLPFLRRLFHTFSLQISCTPFFIPFSDTLTSYFIVKILKLRHNQYSHKHPCSYCMCLLLCHKGTCFCFPQKGHPYHHALDPVSFSLQQFLPTFWILPILAAHVCCFSIIFPILHILLCLPGRPCAPFIFFISPLLIYSWTYWNQASVSSKFIDMVFLKITNSLQGSKFNGLSISSLSLIGFSAVLDMIDHFLLLEIIYCLLLRYTSLLFSTSQAVSGSSVDFSFSNYPLILEFSKLNFDIVLISKYLLSLSDT